MKKITQRAREIAIEQHGTADVSDGRALATLGRELDEWQADIEARLAELIDGDDADVKAVIAAIGGKKPIGRARMPRVPPTPVDENGRTDPVAEADRARANIHADRYNAARFEEEKPPAPTTSRYQPEPEPEPE